MSKLPPKTEHSYELKWVEPDRVTFFLFILHFKEEFFNKIYAICAIKYIYGIWRHYPCVFFKGFRCVFRRTENHYNVQLQGRRRPSLNYWTMRFSSFHGRLNARTQKINYQDRDVFSPLNQLTFLLPYPAFWDFFFPPSPKHCVHICASDPTASSPLAACNKTAAWTKGRPQLPRNHLYTHRGHLLWGPTGRDSPLTYSHCWEQ